MCRRPSGRCLAVRLPPAAVQMLYAREAGPQSEGVQQWPRAICQLDFRNAFNEDEWLPVDSPITTSDAGAPWLPSLSLCLCLGERFQNFFEVCGRAGLLRTCRVTTPTHTRRTVGRDSARTRTRTRTQYAWARAGAWVWDMKHGVVGGKHKFLEGE